MIIIILIIIYTLYIFYNKYIHTRTHTPHVIISIKAKQLIINENY